MKPIDLGDEAEIEKKYLNRKNLQKTQWVFLELQERKRRT